MAAAEEVENQRPSSAGSVDDDSVDTIVDEFAPFLPDGTEPTLYRTISRRSEAGDLPPHDKDVELAKKRQAQQVPSNGVYATISVLLLGVFVAQVDASLVLATYGKVASEFGDLDSGSWLLSAFILAQCVANCLYGKLSDIYGRKHCLQAAYVLFALGTAGTGLGQSMKQVIAWRAVQGCGSAGMTSMVSIIITDMVPLHEVATIRSYVNILQTSGRSCGGVIGGALTYSLGWRWAFLVQVPPTILSIVLVHSRLHLPRRESSGHTQWQKLKRVDFVGAIFLCATIFTICFILETGGRQFPWKGPTIISMAVGAAIALAGFVISAHVVAEPIFPLRLLKVWAVLSNYLIALLQVLLQFSLMTIVPLYFQVTNKANTAQAGAYLIPAFAGNTIGGLASGYFIKRTGLYKPMTVISPLFAVLCMFLCYFFWNGHTTVWESLYILPGGLASGMVSSSIFVGLAAGVPEGDLAITASGLFLFFNLGAVAGASAGAAVYQTSIRAGLSMALDGVTDGPEIMRKALSDISYVQNASDKIRDLFLPAYVYGLHQVNLQSIVCAAICFGIAVFTPQRRLKR
ncbi:Putative major facilitator superfamily, MFS transporter superfamily [Septoria linicola]|uniref:Major facilitator superfamily, MFS transporter superfamily n=1 Tax=Septoria linicola TaxID=215465 RepID=A0A9Q9ELH8_9PEZI|nr:putative major facilitator superfamily, MFS transporter superfamily [Septoria linicola]USW54407.1 Putative major facilitator superfamily, MFS transporter superfamily [Septoria linicola]